MSRVFGWMGLVGWLAGGLWGCGSQAGVGYEGQALMSVNGNVVVNNADAPRDLVPALAFATPAGLRIVDVSARGEFPARFSFDVFAPPPKESVMTPDSQPGRFSLGYITAVTPEHPELIEIANSEESTACTSACDRELKWCTSDNSKCYIEKQTCTGPSDSDCTTVSTSGDETLIHPWKHFAGLSTNYAVLYLWDAAPKGSYFTKLLGSKTELAVGYHLVKLTSDMAGAVAAQANCVMLTNGPIWGSYNQAHGTDYHSIDDVPAAERAAAMKELDMIGARYCPLDPHYTAELIDDTDQAITVELGTDLQPQGF